MNTAPDLTAKLSNAKVDHLDFRFSPENQVARLEVGMDDLSRMHMSHCGGNPFEYAQQPGHRQEWEPIHRSARSKLSQKFGVLGSRKPTLFDLQAVKLDDVGMAEPVPDSVFVFNLIEKSLRPLIVVRNDLEGVFVGILIAANAINAAACAFPDFFKH